MTQALTTSPIQNAALENYVTDQADKTLLRFITCGSVDDGKSTLIGRLLWDTKMIFEDQLHNLTQDSQRLGTQNGDIDFALLTDGLQAEREQGITIDVAYRFFATDKRKFIVADTPGHEQYTRNMATGASTADAALLLIDARKGILDQTRRHCAIAALLGIRHIVLAVNKMDLVGYDQSVFDQIVNDFAPVASRLSLESVTAIPLSALKGENILTPSAEMGWYQGPTLISYLENIETKGTEQKRDQLRFPVQWVNRPNLDFRGYAGSLVSGNVHVGQKIRVAGKQAEAQIERIVTLSEDLAQAESGQAVTLTLDHEIDISRGDVLIDAGDDLTPIDQFSAHLVWMAEKELQVGQSFLLKAGGQTVTAHLRLINHRFNINELNEEAALRLRLNDIGLVDIQTDKPIIVEPYQTEPSLGQFILIDKATNATVAAGMIHQAQQAKPENVVWQDLNITKQVRAEQKNQNSTVLWFTGLSGAGKSTIANSVDQKLVALGHHTYVLDGDNVRHGLNRDLGFSDADRMENIRRVSEVAKLMADAGLIVLVSFISPFEKDRQMARDVVGADDFLEVFIDTDLSVCEERDVKGLYKKARAGEIDHFTGISSPYEAPSTPDITLKTSDKKADQLANQVIDVLRKQGRIFWYDSTI